MEQLCQSGLTTCSSVRETAAIKVLHAPETDSRLSKLNDGNNSGQQSHDTPYALQLCGGSLGAAWKEMLGPTLVEQLKRQRLYT